MEQPHMLPVLYCQYHAYWCQETSRQGIDQISRNISSLASEYSNTCPLYVGLPFEKYAFKWQLVCKSGEVENDIWILCFCLDMYADIFQRFIVIW